MQTTNGADAFLCASTPGIRAKRAAIDQPPDRFLGHFNPGGARKSIRMWPDLGIGFLELQ